MNLVTGADAWGSKSSLLWATHPVREYLGSRVFVKVLGLWKITDLRILRSFFRAPFLTALRADLALAELSFPACASQVQPADQRATHLHNSTPRYCVYQAL